MGKEWGKALQVQGGKKQGNAALDVGFCHLLLWYPQEIHGLHLVHLWAKLVILGVQCHGVKHS